MCKNITLALKILNQLREKEGDILYLADYQMLAVLNRENLATYNAINTSHDELMKLCLMGNARVQKDIRHLKNLLRAENVEGNKILSLMLEIEEGIAEKIRSGASEIF